jgi:hypothetical protein
MTSSQAGSRRCASAIQTPVDTGVFGARTRPAHSHRLRAFEHGISPVPNVTASPAPAHHPAHSQRLRAGQTRSGTRRGPLQNSARFVAVVGAMWLTGCAPTLDVHARNQMHLMTAERGFCLVGCNVRIEMANGSKCEGFTGGINEGYPAGVSVYCDGLADQLLKTNPLTKGLPVSGTLAGETVSVTLK